MSIAILWWLRDKNAPTGEHGFLIQENPTCHRAIKACAPQMWSLGSTAWEMQLLKPACPGARALRQETPLQWKARAPQWACPYTLQLEEKPAQRWRPSTAPQKIHWWFSLQSVVTLVVAKWLFSLLFCFLNRIILNILSQPFALALSMISNKY